MVIVVDLDGTLVRNNGEISDYTKKIFKQCKEEGHIIVVNSGRSLIDSYDAAECIGADYINCFYGNLLVDKNANIIHSNPIKSEQNTALISEISKVCKTWNAVQTIEGSYGDYLPVCKKYNGTYLETQKLSTLESYHTIVGLPLDTEILETAKQIAQKQGLDMKLNDGKICVFLPQGTRKWLGIQKLIEFLGLNKDDIISFGDHMTDYETLANSGVAVAVANSEEKLLEKVKNHTSSNEDDGVAKYLEERIL